MNPILAANIEDVKIAQKLHAEGAERTVDWTAEGLRIERLRLLSDPGFPFWDVSYCYGRIGTELVKVSLPFSQLPKFNMKGALYNEARKTGKFINGLFQSISAFQ